MVDVYQTDTQENTPVEFALRHSPVYLMSIIASAMDAIVTIDHDQNIVIFNQAAELMFGYSAEEVIGKSIHTLLPDRFRGRHQTHIHRFGENGITNRTMGRLGTIYGLRANGEEFPIEASISKIRVNDTWSYTVILRDVTERIKSEASLKRKTEEISAMTQQLWQTAKLATMGELAASVAHELNNPLAILSLRIEALKMKLGAEAAELHDLSIMETEVERMASLVANLLQFSRPGERQLSTLDLREEIDRTLELVNNHLAHRSITVQREYAEAVPLVIVDRQQMRQLFLNLFSNASDAMPSGGVLTIRVNADSNGRAVLVDVQDTGVGILAETIDQVTDPFYTTKPEGKGTGLGLSICRRIIEEHNGAMAISSPGKDQGVLVHVRIPINGNSAPSVIQ